MKLALNILPDVLSDISSAVLWYEKQKEGLGLEFVSDVNDTIERLAETAFFFRIRYKRKNVRWTYPRRFPYRICFYIEQDSVHVFAIIHAARHNREWEKRI